MSTRQRGSSIQRVVLKSGEVRFRFRLDAPSKDGKRKQTTHTYRTEREAREAQSKLRHEVTTGRYIEPTTVTVAEWFDVWLEAGADDWRDTTAVNYRLVLDGAKGVDVSAPGTRGAVPLGSIPVQKLTRAHVERLKRVMSETGGRSGTGRSPRTVAILLGLVRASLDRAVEDEVVGRNVAAAVRKPKQEQREMQTWTAPEMRRFLAAVADEPIVAAWHLSALGLRRGEVLGLRWSDVDFERNVLHVRQARVQAGNTVVTNAPKTDRGRRSIPLHPELVAALKLTRQRTVTDAAVVPLRQKGTAGDRYVVVDAIGEPIKPDHFSTLFERAVVAAGVPRIRLHDVRHTAISLLLAEGVPPHHVARLAGHDPSITMRVYAHATDDVMEEAVGRLGRLYAERL